MTEQPLYKKNIPADLTSVCRRVRQKIESYHEYNFSMEHNNFLKAFFDLAQEYDTLDDFYRICVSVPLEMIGLSCALHICQGKDAGLHLICSSEEGVLENPVPSAYPVQMKEIPYEVSGSYIVPVFSKQPFDSETENDEEGNEKRQTRLLNDFTGLCGDGTVLGMYEIRSHEPLADSDKFFFRKYANRIGYSLENRLIVRQNTEHLKFINTLVVDIEHNIIVPNMYYRHLFNQLRRKIEEITEITGQVRRLCRETSDQTGVSECCADLEELQQELLDYYRELVKHHSNTSLFIESLFRKEHFERGHLVLYPKRCFIEKEVIIPQLEHYASRLKAANITIERPNNMLSEEFALLVDIGLLAQVYANLFSNAAKYTGEIIDHQGRSRKAMAYGREIIHDFAHPGQLGVKFNVFTTGPQLTAQQGEGLFEEGVRGEDSQQIPGTGHGLSFIRHVVEMHGGVAGYEPTGQGNNFYFILPISQVDYPNLFAPRP